MRDLRPAIVLGLALALAPAGPSALATERDREDDPQVLMREGMENLLRAIELMIEMVPQYEAPELTPEGDIIIRRKRRPDERPPEPEPYEEET